MGYFADYKKKNNIKEAGTYFSDYKKKREQDAKDLATEAANSINKMNSDTAFANATANALDRVRRSGNATNDLISNNIFDSIVRSERRNASKADNSFVEKSSAYYEDKQNTNRALENASTSNKSNIGKIATRQRQSDSFINQFENQEDYDNAFNMMKYGNMNYSQLKSLSESGKITGKEKDWVDNYAQSVKTAADTQRELDEINAKRSEQFQNAFTGNTQLPTKAGNINTKSLADSSEKRAELEAEKEALTQKEYYNSLENNKDYQEYVKKGREDKDNPVTNEEYKSFFGMLKDTLAGNNIANENTSPDDPEYMDETEKDRYSYLYAKYGAEEAEKYKEYIQNNINERSGAARAESIKDNVPLELLYGAAAGLKRGSVDAVQNATNLLLNDKALPKSAMQYGSEYVRENLADKGPSVLGSSLGQIGYDLLENTGNMVPSIALGSVVPAGAAASIGSMSGSVAANAANEEMLNGAKKDEAIAYGLVNGALEGGLQSLFGGISAFVGIAPGAIKKYISSKIKNTAAKAVLNIGVSALGEGAEEYLQEIIDPVTRNLTLGENNEIKFITEEALYSGLVGALSGGILDSVNSVQEASKERTYENVGANLSEEKINSLVEYAEGKEELKKAAEDYKKNPTDLTAGILKVETDAQIGREIEKAIVEGTQTEESSDEYINAIKAEATEEARQILERQSESNLKSNALDEMSKGAREALNTAREGSVVDNITFDNAFAEYYEYGKTGSSLEYADEKAISKNDLTDSQKKLAWESGVQDRNLAIKENKIKSFKGTGQLRFINESEKAAGITVPTPIKEMNDTQKDSIMALNKFAEYSGYNIALYASEAVDGKITAPNGWYNPNNDTIYIDVNSGSVGENAILRTASHEITHTIKEWRAEKYSELQDYIVKTLEKGNSLDELIYNAQEVAKRNGISLNREQALDEVIANSCERMLKDSEVITRLASENKDLFEKIKSVIAKVTNAVKKAFDNLRTGSKEYETMKKLLNDWTEIQKIWDDAVVESVHKAKEVREKDNNVNKNDNVYSLRDSEGNELTKKQQTYFEDSKVRDSEGRLLVMYHGTPYGGFTVFKNDLNYFTPNKKYAERYHNPSASSIRGSYKEATKEQTYAVYLNIEKPFDISDPEIRDIFINEYIKGGWAQGINPYLTDSEINKIIKNGIDWVEADNLKEFIEDNEYDYDGLVLNEGGDILPDGTTYDRGVSYVTFNPNQVKSIDNTNPTENEDIRYSYRDDNRSNREILADALINATKTAAERQNLEEYKKIIGKLEAQERLRREKVRAMNNADNAATRDKLELEIRAIDEKIAFNDKKLISMEAAAPLRAVLERESKLRADKDIDELKKRYAENRRSKQMTALRNNIKNNSNSLISMLNNPTNTRHVPEELKKPLKNFLTSIDFISAYANPESFNTKQWQAKMDALYKMVTDDEVNTEIGIDPDLAYSMAEFTKKNDGKKLSDMSYADLEDLYIMVRSLRMSISNANRLFMNNRSADAEKLGYQTIEEMKKFKTKKDHGKVVDTLDKFLNADSLDASNFFKMLGANAKSIYNELFDGWKKRVSIIKDSGEYTQEIYKALDVTQKELDNITGTKAKTYKFNVKGGTLELTKAQIMSLYELNKREQARGHMYGIGVKPDDITRKGKTIKQSMAIKVSKNDIEKITSTLSEKEKALADSMQKYLANECAKWGNETSMKMYGYKKFNEKNYFPIKTYDNALKSNKPEKITNPYAIINTGMTKATVKEANTGLVARDIFDVFTDHVVDMANYNGMAMALTDSLKWFNYKYMTDDYFGSVKEEIERAYGKQYKNYFMNLLLDINGDTARQTESGLERGFIAPFKTAAVGANLRVVVQQPTAYIRAADQIKTKYLVKAVAKKSAYKEAIDNSQLAWWKSQGYFDTGLGQSLKSMVTHQESFRDSVNEKLLAAAGKADELTWGKLWNAVKLEIEDTTDLKPGTEEYMKAVTNRFDQIVDETQVVDTVFSKSQFMRNKDGLSKLASSFMAEPTKTYNMLRSAVVTKDPKKIAHAAAVYLTTATANAALVSFIDAVRKLSYDDEAKEKEYWDRYYDNFIQNVTDNALPTNLLPVIKDISGYLLGEQYSGSNRQDLAWIESLTKACSEVYGKLNGSNKDPYKIAKDCAKAVSQVTGIPFANIYRTFESPVNFIRYDIMGYTPLSQSVKEIAQLKIAGKMDEYKAKIEELKTEGYEVNEIMNKVTAQITKINKEKEEPEETEEPTAEKERSIYNASDVYNTLATGTASDANKLVEDMYATELKNEPDKVEAFKNVRRKIKAGISPEYKKLGASDRNVLANKLKQLTLAKQTLYTDKDIKRLEKQIEAE